MSEVMPSFTLVGVICPIDDGPCICTPIYRHEPGAGYFIQEFKSKTIDGFVYIGSEITEYKIDIDSQCTSSVGDPVQYGLVLPNRAPVVLSLRRLSNYLSENMDDLCIPHPFLLYQLAVITKNRDAFFQALNQKRVEEAIRKRQIPITFAQSKSEKGKWTDESVRLLKYLWDARFSASEIAQAVGQSRNAVIGKVHRLQLKGRDKGGADKIIRLKFGSK